MPVQNFLKLVGFVDAADQVLVVQVVMDKASERLVRLHVDLTLRVLGALFQLEVRKDIRRRFDLRAVRFLVIRRGIAKRTVFVRKL